MAIYGFYSGYQAVIHVLNGSLDSEISLTYLQNNLCDVGWWQNDLY